MGFLKFGHLKVAVQATCTYTSKLFHQKLIPRYSYTIVDYVVVTLVIMNTSWISKKEISVKVYLPVDKLSNRIITSGLNIGRSKTFVVNMSTLPSRNETELLSVSFPNCGRFIFSGEGASLNS